ncbi:MAG: BatA domain-containing protein [Cytophagales bacterium]|nr:BatA domain-containing protein [Cytophagales bacterium]
MFLLQPFWLFSLLGLAIPVAIHLWNRKRGRRIRVGSIALLRETQSRRMSSLRLTEAGLLLLRCLVLALLGLGLAGPRWQAGRTDTQRPLVLVSPALRKPLRDTTGLVRRTLDSLAGPDKEVRWFADGFPALALPEGVAEAAGATAGDYWGLLRAADARWAGGTPVYLLTDERLAALRGERPAVALDLKWLTFPTGDSTARTVREAFLTPSDSLRVTFRESRPEGNGQQVASLPAVPGTYPGPGGTPWRVSRENGLPTVQLGNGRPVRADTTTTRIVIYHQPAYHADARYVGAATEAVARFTGRKIAVQTVARADALPAAADWLFWLSHEPLPDGRPRVAFRYPRTDSARDADTWLRWPLPTARPLRVYRRFTAASPGVPVWQDGYGQPVLTAQQGPAGRVYYFSVRFDPQWNDLAWSEAFPEALLDLLNEALPRTGSTGTDFPDLRGVDTRQLLPRHADRETARPERENGVDLREPLLLAAVLLFGLERLLSHRRQTQIPKKATA